MYVTIQYGKLQTEYIQDLTYFINQYIQSGHHIILATNINHPINTKKHHISHKIKQHTKCMALIYYHHFSSRKT